VRIVCMTMSSLSCAILIIVSARHGHTTLVKWLITKMRAEVNARGSSGETPLMDAASYGHLEAVKCLVETGKAHPGLPDRNGQVLYHTIPYHIIPDIEFIIYYVVWYFTT